MRKYIKYMRFSKVFERIDVPEYQNFLDELIEGGWVVISYDEITLGKTNNVQIVVFCGKLNEY